VRRKISIAKKKRFDPEGSGYDYQTALKHGLKAGKNKHWPSRSPKTGQILKGRAHPTWSKTVSGETRAGYEIYKAPNGRYYSKPRKERK